MRQQYGTHPSWPFALMEIDTHHRKIRVRPFSFSFPSLSLPNREVLMRIAKKYPLGGPRGKLCFGNLNTYKQLDSTLFVISGRRSVRKQ